MKMDLQQFRRLLQSDHPPQRMNPHLLAMWYAGKRDWGQAHNIAQDLHDMGGSWIHAYLHRWEGDEWNAGYWYRKAGKPYPKITLDQEWEEIVTERLKVEG